MNFFRSSSKVGISVRFLIKIPSLLRMLSAQGYMSACGSASLNFRNHLQKAVWNNWIWFSPASTLIRRSYLVTNVLIGATLMSRLGLGLNTWICAWKSRIVGGFFSPTVFCMTMFNQVLWCFCHSLGEILVSLAWFVVCFAVLEMLKMCRALALYTYPTVAVLRRLLSGLWSFPVLVVFRDRMVLPCCRSCLPLPELHFPLPVLVVLLMHC